VGVDRKTGTLKCRHLAEVRKDIEHFAFEPLQVFQRDIEEIASAAGRIKDGYPAEVRVKAAQLRNRNALISGIYQFDRGGFDRFPIGAQRFEDRQRRAFSPLRRPWATNLPDQSIVIGITQLGKSGAGSYSKEEIPFFTSI